MVIIAVGSAVLAVVLFLPVRRHAPKSSPADKPRRPLSPMGVQRFLDTLASELNTGQLGGPALERVDAAGEIATAAVRAHQLGGSVPDGLRSDADRVGSLAIGRLATCWEIAVTTGASLAPAVAALADGERQAARILDEIDAATAEPRATIRVLALLPVAGVVFATTVGIDAAGWLLRTPAGLVCLLAGLALDAAGLFWARRIIASSRRAR